MRDEVLAVERALARAVLDRDRAAAERMLDPEFSAIGHAGNAVDRVTYLDIHFAPERRFVRFDTTHQRVAPISGTVLVHGHVAMVNAALEVNPPPALYTGVYVQSPTGGWHLRFWQETPVRADMVY